MAARQPQRPTDIQRSIEDAEDFRLKELSQYPSGLSIYEVGTYNSASKIELKQFLALHAIWIDVRREDFDPEVWGIKDETFLKEILPAKELLPVPNLGSWSFVWYYIQVVLNLQQNVDEEDEPKLAFSPIAGRTRGKLQEKRDRELRALYAQSPCPPGRGELGPPSDPDTSMQESSFDDELLTMSIEPAGSNPGDTETDSDTDPNYEELPKFNRLGDEQIVNTALIGLLNVLTFSVPGIQAHWSLQRKAFKFGEGDTTLYEARTDGHLFTGAEPLASKIIVEVKRKPRAWIPEVSMQETAQMVAWIFTEPDEHQQFRIGPETVYRRFLISQDRDEIYLIVAEYDSEYIRYLREPSYTSNPPFMKMFLCGPWRVWKQSHIRELGPILLAMTTQLGC
ncbi:uncharacterized protein CIMG_09336 [Coccidioides immitis RS]|uniref:Uncharacterized protein n=1 Tax=Coccidioides immitis (strain RS) TaxID=246410 RepID=A0A0E1RV69_COCIM|nr:uncharacterized protein CIMG_09336 [Coccidioides immitis RS]EAS28132.2 hypothetical protein CIMG_09336 [Coccidioides immitis RS]